VEFEKKASSLYFIIIIIRGCELIGCGLTFLLIFIATGRNNEDL
jgi:hypothetical protein